ncbi:MAG: hypothetical protein RRA32_09985, partial [bacterium]|nr:hypothetical protein [bacterium]
WRPGEPITMIGFPGPAGYISPTWHVEDVNDSGLAPGGFVRYWNEKPAEHGMVVWEMKNK